MSASRRLPARVFWLILLALGAGLPGAASAQGPGSGAGAPLPLTPPTTASANEAPAGPPLSGAALDRATEEVASLMRCPVCQGLSVADSPSSSAVDLKAEVRRMIALGYSEDQVIAAFERSYGEFIRLEPKAEGFNWMVWVMPIVAFAAGALMIFLRLRPQRPAPLASAALPAQEDSKPS
ncbi:MAG: cytochrome c-type biogenesis protein CcmH [Thermoanaerobaculia bacterium]|jgi:cytochrome c-type biogenesis protein CcmH|nr:cytochrome c-type biogenesis protein CcmH [Thermoanaerobaculia bacterium]MBP9822806.1 cytochrome c-type biogenesis protein CcmH [Thermoanaerobaculia bacterium]